MAVWRSHPYKVPKNGDPWNNCHDLVKPYDNEIYNARRDEVDKLLIFAGLLSAAVAAFTVESYKWCQLDSGGIFA
ncbi:hypothetical protein BDQ12DRAFT_606387 [Crucibulum laeve]|uniref:DUF6535 domain-containing protein n=1 Tax=Crucibulum laeve TaxID=68775 RepID=A0A5C3MAL2_9AGAR|nr:hypothetical protein BDQ12DRAFT_606387 [Crucibulum laeve]